LRSLFRYKEKNSATCKPKIESRNLQAKKLKPAGNDSALQDGNSASGQRLRLVAIIVALIVVIAAARLLPIQSYLLEIVEWIRGAGTTGAIVYVLVYIAACVLFLPGSILTLGGGFAYGVLIGAPLVWIGATIGATLAFVLGRTLLREWVARRIGTNAKFAAIDNGVAKNGFRVVLLTRLSPVFPFNLLNYAFGLTQVSLRDYVTATALGILPGTVMYVYLGSLVTSLSEISSGRSSGGDLQRIFYFAGLAVTVVVTIYITRVARAALAEATGTR
jgi:uncharacterized membrane protein YdjX (TVP38/TMEM64 family)